MTNENHPGDVRCARSNARLGNDGVVFWKTHEKDVQTTRVQRCCGPQDSEGAQP